jgi:uncharacterized protein YbaP (TraB family)
MRRLLTSLLFTITFIGGTNAQLLYKISGRGLQKPSYIIGTHHLASASFVDQITGAHEAFDAVEQVYGEVDMSKIDANEALKIMYLADGKNLKDMFSEEEMERINAYMRTLLGSDFTNPFINSQFGKMRPFVLATQLTMMQYIRITPGFNPNSLIDSFFQQEAHKCGKSVGGLETSEFQYQLLYGSMSDEEEREALLKIVDDNEAALAEMQELTKLYLNEDVKHLYKLMQRELKNGDMTPEEWEQMLTLRNRNWVAQMPAIMEDKPTLFVVGAGHLIGSEGLITLLKREGYKVKAVK